MNLKINGKDVPLPSPYPVIPRQPRQKPMRILALGLSRTGTLCKYKSQLSQTETHKRPRNSDLTPPSPLGRPKPTQLQHLPRLRSLLRQRQRQPRLLECRRRRQTLRQNLRHTLHSLRLRRSPLALRCADRHARRAFLGRTAWCVPRRQSDSHRARCRQLGT